MWKKIELNTPRGFDLKLTATSHGWSDLAPFRYDEDLGVLKYTFLSGRKQAISSTVKQKGEKLIIELDIAVSNNSDIPEKVRHILRLDETFEGFHSMASEDENLHWAVRKGAGRLLRSPTVFEDVIKTLCTTNCSWGLTRNMVRNLVESLGSEGSGEHRSFPDAETLAAQNEEFYRNVVKTGYRSPYFVEISNQVAAGEVKLEAWLDAEMPIEELRRQIMSLKGFGQYATDNLLKLLGRYDGLALDSWLRARFYEKYNRGKKCPDKRIHKRYSKFGKWQGLAIWCDMTADWHASADPEK